MPTRLLIPKEQYLASGIHIGMKQKAEQMREFIYKVREDGLAVLNLKKIDERIRLVSKFLARSNKILIATRKPIAYKAVEKFAEITNSEKVIGRFMPGTLTNPQYKKFFEADALVVVDPILDIQAMEEAVKAKVPIVAICDTLNETRDIDLILPSNNKGKKALATIFWLLAREILKERKVIASDKEFEHKVEEFEEE
jgi:small subunit ribosomal protein S2